jgi:hypothetical protein
MSSDWTTFQTIPKGIKFSKTPKDTEDAEVAEDAEDADADQILYQSIVGSLLYAAQATQPDIVFAVAALSRYLLKPYKTHMTAAKRVLRYLKYTADAKLVFSGPGGSSERLVGYTDSDWAGDKYDRKSQGGYIFQNGRSTNFVEIEEADRRCEIDYCSRIPCLLGSNSRNPRTRIPILRR